MGLGNQYGEIATDDLALMTPPPPLSHIPTQPMMLQGILRVGRRWVQSYIQAVTGSVAHGIEAAGIQVSLPREVGTVLAFLEEMGRYHLFPDQLLSENIPFVYDMHSSCLD